MKRPFRIVEEQHAGNRRLKPGERSRFVGIVDGERKWIGRVQRSVGQLVVSALNDVSLWHLHSCLKPEID